MILHKNQILLLLCLIIEGINNSQDSSPALMLSASDVMRIPFLALDRKRKITKKTPVASKSVIAFSCLTLFQQASLAWALIQLSNDVELNPGPVLAEMC